MTPLHALPFRDAFILARERQAQDQQWCHGSFSASVDAGADVFCPILSFRCDASVKDEYERGDRCRGSGTQGRGLSGLPGEPS